MYRSNDYYVYGKKIRCPVTMYMVRLKRRSPTKKMQFVRNGLFHCEIFHDYLQGLSALKVKIL